MQGHRVLTRLVVDDEDEDDNPSSWGSPRSCARYDAQRSSVEISCASHLADGRTSGMASTLQLRLLRGHVLNTPYHSGVMVGAGDDVFAVRAPYGGDDCALMLQDDRRITRPVHAPYPGSLVRRSCHNVLAVSPPSTWQGASPLTLAGVAEATHWAMS